MTPDQLKKELEGCGEDRHMCSGTWRRHFDEVFEASDVPPHMRSISGCATSPKEIGYEPFAVRPGEIGRYDLLGLLDATFGGNPLALQIAGLTKDEVHSSILETEPFYSPTDL